MYNYPGAGGHHHHHSQGAHGAPPPPGWNTARGPSPGFPNTPGFPSPGYGAPPGPPGPGAGYSPGYSPGYNPSYAPPGGPPGGFAAPSGPPPPSSTYPGQSGGYAPPGGPPPGGHSPYGPPPGGHSPYGPPPGPPPGQWDQNPSWGGPQNGFGGGYAPPPGPPHMPPRQEQFYGPQFEGTNHQQAQPFFQYSQCNGKRKALCIGINYFGQSAELSGCINDANNMKRFLCGEFGYKVDDIVMLTDDAQNPRQIPTRDNMLQAMQWLVRDAQPNDSLFFHYSGHGGQTKDLDGDEDDGFDETIYPVDFEASGQIVDDVLHEVLVRPLPPGCRLTAIFDSCHSGSALDLPYIYSTEGKIKEPNLAAEAGQGLLSAVSSYARGDMGGVLKSAMGVFKAASGGNQKASAYAKQTRTSPADAISFSGCKDSQTSADTVEAGSATGAMSYAFISALSAKKQQTYQELLNNLRTILKGKYSQKPQLSSSHPIDTNIIFIA